MAKSTANCLNNNKLHTFYSFLPYLWVPSVSHFPQPVVGLSSDKSQQPHLFGQCQIKTELGSMLLPRKGPILFSAFKTDQDPSLRLNHPLGAYWTRLHITTYAEAETYGMVRQGHSLKPEASLWKYL